MWWRGIISGRGWQRAVGLMGRNKGVPRAARDYYKWLDVRSWGRGEAVPALGLVSILLTKCNVL